MTLPEYALKYDDCSLQELRKFVTDRKIPFKYTHPEAHTKKSEAESVKEERSKLLTALRNDDATAKFRLLDLPPELRDEVYYHFLLDMGLYKGQLSGDFRKTLQPIPTRIRGEMSAVFEIMMRMGSDLTTPLIRFERFYSCPH